MKKAIGAKNFITIDDISKLLKTKCCITVRFWNIQSTTTHGIKYSNKFISMVNPIIENGRIHAAKIIEVMLTESDYARYKKFYKWDDMEIIEQDILKLLKTKAKKNSFYGCCVTQLQKKKM